MDGYDSPVSSMPPTNRDDAMLHLATRLGGIEQALRGVVTHEKLMQTWNDLRRDVAGLVRDNETHVRGMIETSDTRADKRSQELQAAQDRRHTELLTSLDRMMNAKVDAAVEKRLKDRDDAEAKARKEIDNKAKDAVRGWRALFSGGGAIFGIALAVLALFVLKTTFNWSPF